MVHKSTNKESEKKHVKDIKIVEKIKGEKRPEIDKKKKKLRESMKKYYLAHKK